jgi:hypothetical protein
MPGFPSDRSVAIDVPEFKYWCDYLGWSHAKLSREADISVRTLERIKSDGRIGKSNYATILETMQIAIKHKAERTGVWPQKRLLTLALPDSGGEDVSGICAPVYRDGGGVEIAIGLSEWMLRNPRGDFSDLDPDTVRELQEAVGDILRRKLPSFSRFTESSLNYHLDLTYEEAELLRLAVEAGRLRKFGIESLVEVVEKHFDDAEASSDFSPQIDSGDLDHWLELSISALQKDRVDAAYRLRSCGPDAIERLVTMLLRERHVVAVAALESLLTFGHLASEVLRQRLLSEESSRNYLSLEAIYRLDAFYLEDVKTYAASRNAAFAEDAVSLAILDCCAAEDFGFFIDLIGGTDWWSQRAVARLTDVLLNMPKQRPILRHQLRAKALRSPVSFGKIAWTQGFWKTWQAICISRVAFKLLSDRRDSQCKPYRYAKPLYLAYLAIVALLGVFVSVPGWLYRALVR